MNFGYSAIRRRKTCNFEHFVCETFFVTLPGKYFLLAKWFCHWIIMIKVLFLLFDDHTMDFIPIIIIIRWAQKVPKTTSKIIFSLIWSIPCFISTTELYKQIFRNSACLVYDCFYLISTITKNNAISLESEIARLHMIWSIRSIGYHFYFYKNRRRIVKL